LTAGGRLVGSDKTPSSASSSSWIPVILAWSLVTIPLLWGIWQTAKKAVVLFR
jgi:hypothetical protein